MSNSDNDMIMSHLRLHANRLDVLLSKMEKHHPIDHDFLGESLRDIEFDIRQLRRFLGKTGLRDLILGRSLFL